MSTHIDASNKQVEVIIDILNALNDETRQRIILLFQQHKELCVNEIASQFEIGRPTISHHLNLMKRSKILSSRKEGKEVYYSFNKDYVIETLQVLIAYFRGCC